MKTNLQPWWDTALDLAVDRALTQGLTQKGLTAVVFLSTYSYRNVLPSVFVRWGVSKVLRTGHDSELEIKESLQLHFLHWCLSGSPQVKDTTSISKNKWQDGHIFQADPWPLKTGKSQKLSKVLCVLGLAFLFSSEEANRGFPDVAHGLPNELGKYQNTQRKQAAANIDCWEEGGWVIPTINWSNYWKCWQKLNAEKTTVVPSTEMLWDKGSFAVLQPQATNKENRNCWWN